MRAIMMILLLTAASAGPSASGAALPLVGEAWSRATPPGAAVAAVYLTIDNRGGRADRLLSLSSPAAGRVEVHSTVRDMDVVRMRRVDPLHVAAGERLLFEPGGTHVMLIGLAAPLVAGQRLPLLLVFERAGEVRVEATVRAADAIAPASGGHHH